MRWPRGDDGSQEHGLNPKAVRLPWTRNGSVLVLRPMDIPG